MFRQKHICFYTMLFQFFQHNPFSLICQALHSRTLDGKPCLIPFHKGLKTSHIFRIRLHTDGLLSAK